MGLFGKKKKVVDLSDFYRKQAERNQNIEEKTDSESNTLDDSAEEKGTRLGEAELKKKLAKRIVDMTTQIEHLSNQIYHLQQRIELLEKKLNVKGE